MIVGKRERKICMKRKSEARKNTSFYIAVCCCVTVMAAVGYVSRSAKKIEEKTPAPKVIAENRFTERMTGISRETPKEDPAKDVPVREESEPVSQNVYAEDNTPEFKYPVKGKIIGEFSGENLVFCENLSDWRSHSGTDFKAKEGDDVFASADGVVESVYADGMGNCIVIDHENGFKTLYANLGDSETDLSGQNVHSGDKIGVVGKSAVADLTREEHLHFEVLKDGVPVNPTEYLK